MILSKDTIRDRIWTRMERERLARFPGARGRIPNFPDAAAAAERLAATEAWKRARVLKCNPDAPQRYVRHRALREGKIVLMAVPRLRERECFVLLDPAGLAEKSLYEASAITGAFRHGRPIHPSRMPAVDLVVAGSVAVNRRGERIGKGGGYSDLEWALGRELGYLAPEVRVATTVHPVQLVREKLPILPHDLTVDVIATPEEVIEVRPRPRKPSGINWKLVSPAMLEEIPILRELTR